MATEAERAREFVEVMVATQDRLMRAMGIPVESRPYLTGNLAVTTPRPNVVVKTLPDATGFYWDWETDGGEAAEAMRSIWARVASDIARSLAERPDPSRYPHTCPRCSGPAYVGAVEVDCAGGCK